MAYTHLTMKELDWIETYNDIGYKAYEIAKKLGRSNQPIYNVVNFLKQGGTIHEYFEHYKQNKSKCGAKKKTLRANRRNTLRSVWLKARHLI